MYSVLASLLNLKIPVAERYSVLQVQGPFEVRLYQRMVCAKMSLTGPYEDILKIGSRYLSEYFDGNNFKVEKVESTGCLFQVMRENGLELGVILPANVTISNAPQPINRMIRINELPTAKVASLSFRGTQSHELFTRRGEELKRWLDFKGIQVKGPLRVMRVTSSTMPFLRNYEVQFEIF